MAEILYGIKKKKKGHGEAPDVVVSVRCVEDVRD